MFQRYTTILIVFLCFSALALQDTDGAIQYTVTDLGTLGGTVSQATGINSSGQVMGHAYTSSNVYHAFLYSGGTMTDLGTLGGERSWAYDINDSGQVVGVAMYDSSWWHAFLYNSSNGTMIDIDAETSGVNNSGAYGINNSGQIVGYASFSTHASHAFLYSGGSMSDLSSLTGTTYSQCTSINSASQIVGLAHENSSRQYAFLYSGGTLAYLDTGYAYSAALDINASTQIVGYASQNSSADKQAFVYNLDNDAAINLGTLGGSASEATGINDNGIVVGTAETSSGIEHAFFYSSGTMTDLNDLIDATGWILQKATAINNNGQIVGYGICPAGQQHAFLLTPIPEPSATILLGVGVIGLVGYVWRRYWRLGE